MKYKVTFLSEAKFDLKEIIEWYNEKKTGLGSSFYLAFKSKVSLMENNPFQYQENYKEIRSVNITRFPYQIHFRIDEVNQLIIVLAVAHSSRNPQNWKKRS